MKEIFVKHQLRLLNSKEKGIAHKLDSWSSQKMIEKYSVSFDNESKIERIREEQISFGERVSDTIFFNRLLRDIESYDTKTRGFASVILCSFLEDKIEHFDLNILKKGIEKIVKQITVEKNPNAEHKLVEGLFEYIWWKNLIKMRT